MASIIKPILDSLEKNDQDAINYAFEHGLTYFVELPESRFIGVNITHVPHLYPDTNIGVWSIGRIAREAEFVARHS